MALQPALGSVRAAAAESATAAADGFVLFARHCTQAGLRFALEQTGDSPSTLQRVAYESLCFEEQVATGCLMIQAITLVRVWTLTFKQQPTSKNEQQIIQWRTCPHPQNKMAAIAHRRRY